VRAECLDHSIILGEVHLRASLGKYCAYFNTARPHQGIEQKGSGWALAFPTTGGAVVEIPVLGGLHHEYRLAA
jgi:putative transposase